MGRVTQESASLRRTHELNEGSTTGSDPLKRMLYRLRFSPSQSKEGWIYSMRIVPYYRLALKWGRNAVTERISTDFIR